MNAEATWTDSSGQEKAVDSNLPGLSLPVVQPLPTDGNTDPYFAAEQVSRDVDENAAPRTAIGDPVGASDDDEWSATGFGTLRHDRWLTYSLGGASAALFDIDRVTGQISTRAPLDHETASSHTVTVRVEDPAGGAGETTVTITVNPVDEPPVFTIGGRPVLTDRVVVFHDSGDEMPVGITLGATDPEGADITWSRGGTNANLFTLVDGVLAFVTTPTHDPNGTNQYEVEVRADDAQSGGQRATLTVIVAVPSDDPTQGPRGGPISFPGPGPGGPGGFPGGGPAAPSGPTPSEEDFEWNVERDIEALDPAQQQATDTWSDGRTIWVADNASGSGDAVYAYDLATGERVEGREFELDPENLAPRGLWADGATAWVADSGRDRLFAYDLETGERRPERDVVLVRANGAARGLFGGGGLVWVLNANPSLFVYDLETGAVIGVYELATANSDPRGIWTDGVSLWVSDHSAKRIFAYRLPDPEAAGPAAAGDPVPLQRVRDEEFTELTSAGNLSPRGIWSDGDVMYVADANDGRVYTYNMPEAIDARLASLALGGVTFGEFSPLRTEYEGERDEGVEATTVTAEAVRPGATIAIAPADADPGTAGHQVDLGGLDEITVTVAVTSADGSRTRVYGVRFAPPPEPEGHCLAGDIGGEFSFVVHRGGALDDLDACAASRSVVGLYALHEGAYVAYIPGAPTSANGPFRELFPDGVPPFTPLVAAGSGSPSPDPTPGSDSEPPGPECLHGAVSEGFSAVVYEGGSVDDLAACAGDRGIVVLYTLHEGRWVSYILEAPASFNRPFRDLFGDGIPPATPLIVVEAQLAPAGSDEQDDSGSTATTEDTATEDTATEDTATEEATTEEATTEDAATEEAATEEATTEEAATEEATTEEATTEEATTEDTATEDSGEDTGAPTQQQPRLVIGNTGGDGVSHRTDCDDNARLARFGWADGTEVEVVTVGDGRCARWLRVRAGDGVESWVREEYLRAIPTEEPRLVIGNTGGAGVSHRNDCADGARLPRFGWADGTEVQVLSEGQGRCAGWLWVRGEDGVTSWVRVQYVVEA